MKGRTLRGYSKTYLAKDFLLLMRIWRQIEQQQVEEGRENCGLVAIPEKQQGS